MLYNLMQIGHSFNSKVGKMRRWITFRGFTDKFQIVRPLKTFFFDGSKVIRVEPVNFICTSYEALWNKTKIKQVKHSKK